ncbi:MAG: hypothetical protein H6557_01590 [Lewinellaceae bacterium]|nr:hypothetical protein [Phaeodactylibacter sp.]MCB9035290.1 hypothetical protein [Lewinellaceae bacterium]
MDWLPATGQQLVEAVGGVIFNAPEDSIEIIKGFDIIELATDQQRIKQGCSFSSVWGTIKEVVLPIKGNVAHHSNQFLSITSMPSMV